MLPPGVPGDEWLKPLPASASASAPASSVASASAPQPGADGEVED
jgi:hypothetical protein